jgi:hypothetical protein
MQCFQEKLQECYIFHIFVLSYHTEQFWGGNIPNSDRLCGQSLWLQIQRSRVRFPALPDFMGSSGSGKRCTQPREVNWGATWIKCSGSRSRKQRLTAMGICCTDHVTSLYPQKLALTSVIGGSRSVSGGKIFCTCPDKPWGPPSLLYNGYRVFPRGK